MNKIITTASLCMLLQNPAIAKESPMSNEYVNELEQFISTICEDSQTENEFFTPSYLNSNNYTFACDSDLFFFGYNNQENQKVIYEISILDRSKLLSKTWEVHNSGKSSEYYQEIIPKNPIANIFPEMRFVSDKKTKYDQSRSI